MDPNSPTDTELSVTLSPPLREWLGERSEALGIPPAVLLEQLLEAHRDVAERDGDVSTALEELVDIEGEVESALEGRHDTDSIERIETDISDLTGRVDDIDAKLTNNVEDLRKRVLQLRDAIEKRAHREHTHEEFETFDTRIDHIEENIESVLHSLDEVDSAHDRLDQTDGKLDRLASAIVAVQRQKQAAAADDAILDEIKQDANETGTRTAKCGACDSTVRISLLSRPNCPHCERRFEALEEPTSRFGWFQTATLTVTDDSALEADDE